MKILEIITQFGIGGAERFCLDLSNELSGKNDVIICVFHPIEESFHYYQEISPNVKVICMNKKKGFDIFMPFRIFKLIFQERPEIVHSHLSAILYSSMSSLLFRQIKFFHTVHNAAKQETEGKIGAIVRKFLFKTGLVKPITISKDSEKSFENFYGFNATMIYNGRNVPNQINVEPEVKEYFKTMRKTPDTRIIVQLAHIGYQKRQIVMAKAIDKLNKEGYNLVVLMIGKKAETGMIQEIESLCNQNILITGPKSNPLSYLSEADAFGLSSSYEGLPISLIEAMGVGCVPICTPVGGIKDLIEDGVNGFLSKDISEDEYYLVLKRFADISDEKMHEMSIKAKETYMSFSMTECAAQYLDVFENA